MSFRKLVVLAPDLSGPVGRETRAVHRLCRSSTEDGSTQQHNQYWQQAGPGTHLCIKAQIGNSNLCAAATAESYPDSVIIFRDVLARSRPHEADAQNLVDSPIGS